ncbi:SlyX family protein [Xanthomonas sp. WHRI 1810A]|jgi:SlyX protein|uniref:SlyX family protein n=1 Tax=Xanthomonas sp. WHRI 1810A TaxID=3161565 RepID=UPI0032E89E44
MNVDDRVTELETRLAFQDDTIQALNDVLVVQQRTMERLQRQVAALIKRQDEMGGQFEASEEDAPPPHY